MSLLGTTARLRMIADTGGGRLYRTVVPDTLGRIFTREIETVLGDGAP